MSKMLLNNTLCIDGVSANNISAIESIKSSFSRFLLATAGFYKSVNDNDFTSYILLNGSDEILSIRVVNSACYLGVYNKQSGELSLNTDSDTLLRISENALVRFFTKLSLSEDYYLRNGCLPKTMHNAAIERKWNNIIAQLKTNKQPEPTRLADILKDDMSNVSKAFWEVAKQSSDNVIKYQIIPRDFGIER